MKRLLKTIVAIACTAGLAFGAVTLTRQHLGRTAYWRIEPLGVQAAQHVAQPSQGLNLNTATLVELMALPRIGPVLAERIVAYREAMGGFIDSEELIRLSGIGEVTYRELQDLICVCTPIPELSEGMD